jgi:hypothetical protein
VQLHARVAKGDTLDPTATIVASRMIDKGQKAAPSDGGSSTDNTGTDTSGTDNSGTDNSGSDSSTPPANG